VDADCRGNKICCSGVCAAQGDGCEEEAPVDAPLCAACDDHDDCIPGLACCRQQCLTKRLAERYQCPLPDCDNEETRACATGLPGVCADGEQLCRGRHWQDCEPLTPAGPELCNGLDDDCDGAVPGDEADGDGDGFAPCAGDCDDGRPTTFPGAPEVCNGLDDDCDGAVPGEEADGDGDGFAPCAGDCDDDRPEAFPGADEACNGLDDDCDGALPEPEVDGDGDGVSPCAGDCDDAEPAVSPVAEEVCNGIDDDCDGTVDLAADGDGLCPVGQFCARDEDCAADLVCITFGDESRCSHWCNNSYEVPAQVADHECSAGTGCIFAVDTDSAGWCWPMPGAGLLGDACTVGDDCRSGLCEALPSGDRICLDTCSSTADCLGRESVDGLACVVLDFEAGFDGHLYTHGQCIPAPSEGRTGDPCETAADCRDGVCLDGDDVCADTCCTSNDCPADHHCRYLVGATDSSVKVCLHYPAGDRPFGADCEENLFAGSCSCVGALCLEPTQAGQRFCTGTCCRNADCPAGWTCALAVQLPGSDGAARACVPPAAE